MNRSLRRKPQAYNNVVISGSLAYLAVDYCGLEIVDISEPAAPRQVGWWNPWRCETLGNLWFNSKGHTNQIVLDRKAGRVVMSAGDSELQVVDVRTPRAQTLAASFGTPGNGHGAWGVGVADGVAILTYIKAFVPFRGRWSGFKAVALPR